MAWPGLAWYGLTSTGLDWTGLGWAGLGWTGLGWPGLAWAGLMLGFFGMTINFDHIYRTLMATLYIKLFSIVLGFTIHSIFWLFGYVCEKL